MFFEGENTVSTPQNRHVCDGLVTALSLKKCPNHLTLLN